MNTTNTEPKSVELSTGGRSIVCPNGDTSIIMKGGVGIFLESHDMDSILIVREQLLDRIKEKPLQFPELPEGEEWSNPANLTPEQFGEGYRPLLKSEVKRNLERVFPTTEFVEGWNNGYWQNGYFGDCQTFTYRTKAPLPTQKEKEEPETIIAPPGSLTQDVTLNGMTFHVDNGICDILGKRAMAKFLRGCRCVVILNPAEKWEPFGNEIPTIVVVRGVTEKLGEISPDLTWDAYNGESFPIDLSGIRSITV